MIVGCYTLHLYCDTKLAAHRNVPFPGEYCGETASECRQLARKVGWKLDLAKGTATCPNCVRAQKEQEK